jgi:hypothetical protein
LLLTFIDKNGFKSTKLKKMPKNKGKGGKNRRRGKNENDDVKRELVQKEEGQGN